MMKRLKALDLFQKGILIALAVMIVLFTVLYIRANSRSGIVYKNTFLYRGTEGENIVYSGTLHDKPAQFTVGPDGKVLYRYGDKSFGAYLVNRDDSIIPNMYRGEAEAGVEIFLNGEKLFRGTVYEGDWLIDESGNYVMPSPYIIMGGQVYADGGNGGNAVNVDPVDPDEPSLNAIAKFALGLDQTNKGSWVAWLVCVLLSIGIALSILYADELFRWSMSFHIRNADRAEPSDWELTFRYFGWFFASVAVLVMFIFGLNAVI